MRRKDGEAGARRLVLIWCAERPKGNWPTSELGEPALELRLSGVVGKAAHVEHFAALGEEGPDVGTGVHGAGEHVGVLVEGL